MLSPVEAGFYRCFIQLSASRQHGFSGPQPISIGDMLARSMAWGVLAHDRFIELVRTLDDAYLAWADGKRQADKKP